MNIFFLLKRFHKVTRCILSATSIVCVTTSALAEIRYSGSDTLEPVVSAALVAYLRGQPGYKFPIQSTGTSVGFRELCAGRTHLAGASRSIKPEEAKICANANVQLTELPVAYDALSLVVSSKNTWLKDLSFTELQMVFDPASVGRITSWKQVRTSFPDAPIRPAGPDIKHGTFASFSDSVGLKGFVRSDYKDFSHHEKTGRYVADNVSAIGFMPFGDAVSMSNDLRIIGIDFGSGPVIPSSKELLSGKYDKLSRTIYLYANLALLTKAEPNDQAFFQFLVRDMEKFTQFANLIPLRALQYQENIKRVSANR